MRISLADRLHIDACATSEQLSRWVRKEVCGTLRRRGAVVALSGGVDSSVVAALCVRALGPERVLGLLMPEQDSSPESLRLAHLVADSLGVNTIVEDITRVLQAFGCYSRRDAAIRSVLAEYGEGYRSKIVLPGLLEPPEYSLFSLITESPCGRQSKVRLTAAAYLGVVAATNFKQRTRKTLEYYHADRLQYAVVGTPNRLEVDLGFFVKNGDGAADLKPIAGLYKSQVYQLAEHLGIPERVRTRVPTTDTYSLLQTQEEFYFSIPLEHMDVCLYASEHDIPMATVAQAIGFTPEQVARVFAGIAAKRNVARYLGLGPLCPDDTCLAEPIPVDNTALSA